MSKDRIDRRIGLKRRNLVLWLVCIVSLVLALRGPVLLSRAWGNAGMAALTRALIGASDALPAAARAETLLQRAVAYVPGNRSAWRGLGFALAIQAREDEAIDAWQTAGVTAQEFIRRGEQGREAGQYRQALKWYERAVQIEPDLGDAWYHVGLAYEGTEQWTEALATFQYGISLPLIEVGQSDVYYKVGWLQAQKIEPPDLRAALESLDAAIAQDQFFKKSQAVETHYQRGEVLRRMGLSQEAMQEYEWVVENVSDHYYAHIRLGHLAWDVEQDAVRAEMLFSQALAVDGSRQQAYMGLAKIFWNTDRTLEAIEMYHKVLQLDPENAFAAEQLDKLLSVNE